MVIIFPSKPSVLAGGVAAGPLEKRSIFSSYFDVLYDDERWQMKTNEQGHRQMVQEACQSAIKKLGVQNAEVDYFLGGDLVNQMTPTNFAARELAMPFIGLFSACATSVSSVIVASLLAELGAAKLALAGASSQHNAVERQFRYPVDYGAQKPQTAQWTVTAAGYALIGQHREDCPAIEAATVGKVVDYGMDDPFHMGAAMAPAAFQTIQCHLEQREQKIYHYDLILTGDLGQLGLKLLKGMFVENGVDNEELTILRDAGAEFYGQDEAFQSGASGAGCSAAVFFSYVLQQMRVGTYKHVLLVATGALLSPLSFQQGETIPCTAHAVELTMK
ncbi:stage V sporulation protein AD [Lysinibacillus piscis]|uniref:Stage V sporulation protein AD n=1 Tax=Lysinibacillus piscis TaxID=2518931 RepID=A0ABQ5NI45_9BACI|nr:stage V sporulation protein AD [Lysinibacillus sp. KH24]GLC87724.1 stage V sporulation protein AD [Lysinibacillus sp. KH24]